MQTKIVPTFLKGALMGACDVIPGISAGTIAFITGIYERLINAIKGFSPTFFAHIFLFIFGQIESNHLREDIRKMDLKFLLILVGGIFISIVLFSRVVLFLLDRYFSFTMIFFVGLILASAKTIFDHIEKHHSLNTLIALVGLAIGVSFAFIVPASISPSLPYVFLGGFLAISAMILPGISGAFILLVIGLYQFMLKVISNLSDNLVYLGSFALGAILGLFTISRVVSWLFRKDKSKTLYFLLGLVVGGLSVPVREITKSFDTSALSIVVHIVLLALGIGAATYIRKLSKN